MKPYKLTDKVYVTPNAILEFGSKSNSNGVDAGYNGGALGLNSYHAGWGEKDAVLYEMQHLCNENPSKWRLMTTRRDFIIASGLIAKSKFQDPNDDTEDDDARELIDRLYLDELLRDAALNLEFSGRFFIKLTLGFEGKAEAVDLIDVFHCRPRRMTEDENRITAYILNKNFGTQRFRPKDNVVIPAFDKRNPKKHAVSIIDIRDMIPGQIYNTIAPWWGTKEWTKVANRIPTFHLNALNNGFNPKFHVSIPDNYFEAEGMSKEEQEDLKYETCRIIDERLRGKTDAVIFTFHSIDINGKEMTGVIVTPLPNNMSDDAFTQLFATANNTQTDGHGFPPVLGGINTGSKLGGSGKEMEVAARYVQAYLVLGARFLLLQFVGYLARLEGISKHIKFEFKNIELYNFDVTPTEDPANPHST